MVITVCGSSKFKEEIFKAAEELTLQNHIVLTPIIFHHADNKELTVEQKIMLDNIHRQKIDLSDAIYVVNVDGYIGESTFGEIDWAAKKKKEIYFLIPVTEQEEAKEKKE